MQFVSKSEKLMIVLKHGMPGNTQLGTAAVNGVYVKFQSGIVDVKEPALIELMLKHPGFNIDFIAVEEGEKDPFAYNRIESEPGHTLTEVKYGHVEKSVGTKKPAKFSPEVTKMLNDQAVLMAKEMLPGMMKEFLQQMKEEQGTPSDKDESLPEKASKAPFCTSCDSKGVKHKRECPSLTPEAEKASE